MDKKKFKLNNAGMTLVECIVAVTILSVAMIPLMTSFAYSLRYEAKSKMKQRSTNVAQEVMESFKAESLKDLKLELSTGKDSSGANYDVFNNVSWSNADLSLVLPNGTGTYKLNNVSAGESSTPFNVVVDVKSKGIEAEMFNGIETAYVEVMPDDQIDKALNDLDFRLSVIRAGGNQIRSISVSRDININISGGDISIEYVYHFVTAYGKHTGNDYWMDIYYDYYNVPLNSSTESMGTNDGLVLFYYPIYNGNFTRNVDAVVADGPKPYALKYNYTMPINLTADNINLKSNDIDGLRFFVFKEDTFTKYASGDPLRKAEYVDYDTNYAKYFASINYASSTAVMPFSLYTNVHKNIYQPTLYVTNLDTVSPNGGLKRTELTNLADGNRKQLLYDITIKVYTVKDMPGYTAGSLVSTVNATVIDEFDP